MYKYLGWIRYHDDEEFADMHIETIVNQFEAPLRANRMDCNMPVLLQEWHSLVEYALKVYRPSTEKYKTTWKRLFACEGGDFKNILVVVELCFAMPVSSSVVERCFSTLKQIKTDMRSSLTTETLEGLIRISIESPPTESFDVTPAMEAWALETVRRPNQKGRQYKARGSAKANICWSSSSEDE